MNSETYCSICKAPWHPSTGHYISPTSRWCGPCTREHVKWIVGHLKRRWGRGKFYDHALPPPAAKLFSYVFSVDLFTPVEGKPHTSSPLTLRSEGVNEMDAYVAIQGRIPEGHRVWCWWQEDEEIPAV